MVWHESLIQPAWIELLFKPFELHSIFLNTALIRARKKTQGMGFNNTHIVMGIPREHHDFEKSFVSEFLFHTVLPCRPNYSLYILEAMDASDKGPIESGTKAGM